MIRPFDLLRRMRAAVTSVLLLSARLSAAWAWVASATTSAVLLVRARLSALWPCVLSAMTRLTEPPAASGFTHAL